MDDLISRKATIDQAMVRTDYVDTIFDKATESEIVYMLRSIPSVEAVPLEPLCQWLAGYAAPPNYALDEVRDDSIDPESLVYTANDRAKAWEFHFRELLKSGLMDTEESNAENK